MQTFKLKTAHFFTRLDLKRRFKKGWNDLFVEPFYILLHPIKGFYEFKADKIAKPYVAIVYLILMSLTQVIQYNSTGFLVNPNNPNDFNALRLIMLVVVPVVVVTIGNWSITSLFDGKGRLKEIFMVLCYGFFPYVWITLPNIVYSNFLVIDEIGFYLAFQNAAVFLMGFMMFFGLLGIHEYGLFKTLITLLFTALAIGVISFISFLFLTLFQTVYSFLYSLISEFVERFIRG